MDLSSIHSINMSEPTPEQRTVVTDELLLSFVIRGKQLQMGDEAVRVADDIPLIINTQADTRKGHRIVNTVMEVRNPQMTIDGGSVSFHPTIIITNLDNDTCVEKAKMLLSYQKEYEENVPNISLRSQWADYTKDFWSKYKKDREKERFDKYSDHYKHKQENDTKVLDSQTSTFVSNDSVNKTSEVTITTKKYNIAEDLKRFNRMKSMSEGAYIYLNKNSSTKTVYGFRFEYHCGYPYSYRYTYYSKSLNEILAVRDYFLKNLEIFRKNPPASAADKFYYDHAEQFLCECVKKNKNYYDEVLTSKNLSSYSGLYLGDEDSKKVTENVVTDNTVEEVQPEVVADNSAAITSEAPKFRVTLTIKATYDMTALELSEQLKKDGKECDILSIEVI